MTKSINIKSIKESYTKLENQLEDLNSQISTINIEEQRELTNICELLDSSIIKKQNRYDEAISENKSSKELDELELELSNSYKLKEASEFNIKTKYMNKKNPIEKEIKKVKDRMKKLESEKQQIDKNNAKLELQLEKLNSIPTNSELNEMLETNLIINNPTQISIIRCSNSDVNIYTRRIVGSELTQLQYFKLNNKLDRPILDKLKSLYPESKKDVWAEQGLYKLVNENNTSLKDFTIKYDENGDLINENEIVEKGCRTTILNNALDRDDEINTKNLITVSYPMTKPSKDKNIRKQNSDKFKKFLSYYCTESSGVDLNTLLKFMVQSNVEYRTSARPSLILCGTRGVGKDFLIETVSCLYSNLGKYTDDPGFNEYLLSPFINVDEKSENRATFYNTLKTYSTKSGFTINTKYGAKIVGARVEPTWLISSNNRPISISDEITNEYENPFLYIELNDKKVYNADNFHKMRESIFGSNFINVKESMPQYFSDFLFTEGFKIYKEILEQRNKKYCRFGIPIPISRHLKNLISNSIPDNVQKLLSNLANILSFNNIEQLDSKWKKDINEIKRIRVMMSLGYIQPKLLTFLFERHFVRKEVFMEILKKESIISEKSISKWISTEIGNASVFEINIEKLKNFYNDFNDVELLDIKQSMKQSNKIEEVKSNVTEPTIVEEPSRESNKIEIKQESLESELKSISKRIEELEDDLIPNLSVGDELLGVGLDYENELKSLKNRRKEIKKELR